MPTDRPQALVVVESRHGSTLGIAGALSQRLVFHGFGVHVVEPNDCSSIDADVVIIGSAVYLGKWLKPAVRFIDDHSLELASLPVWLFSSGPLDEDPAIGEGIEDSYVADLMERAHARAHHVFSGRLDRSSLGPVEALIAHSVDAPDGDFRDWPEINEWADEIAVATNSKPTHADIATVVRAATLAPSSHNSQPWRFEIHEHAIELYADRERRLPINDPMDRELVMSCGAALANLEVASGHLGSIAHISALPDPDDPEHLARVTFEPGVTIGEDLFDAIEMRRTTRDGFDATMVDDVALHGLVAAGTQFGVEVTLVDLDHRELLSEMVADADAAQFGDADWRRELATWMHPTDADDGLPVHPLMRTFVRLIVSHFDVGRSTAAKDARLALEAPLVVMLSTEHDDRVDWVAAGRALERLLLAAANRGLSTGFLNQVCQVAGVRARLQAAFCPGRAAQVVLRIGHTTSEGQAPRRRPLHDVLSR